MGDNKEMTFDEFMDTYGEKELELIQNREEFLKQNEDLENLDGKNEFLERDMLRHQMYYGMWSICVVILLIVSINLFKDNTSTLGKFSCIVPSIHMSNFTTVLTLSMIIIVTAFVVFTRK